MNSYPQPSSQPKRALLRENMPILVSLALNLLLCLAIVWIHSIPYIRLSKAIREASRENRKLSELTGQLEAERNVLGNQASLERKIRELGLDLSRPRPGQIRRLEP